MCLEVNLTDVSHYISLDSFPHAIAFLIYFDFILIVHVQNECVYLGEFLSVSQSLLTLIRTVQQSLLSPLTIMESTCKPVTWVGRFKITLLPCCVLQLLSDFNSGGNCSKPSLP